MKSYTCNGVPLDIIQYIGEHVLTYRAHIIPISKLEIGQSVSINGDQIACVPATPEIFAIEQLNFSSVGPDDDPDTRMRADIRINDVHHHVELIEVAFCYDFGHTTQHAKHEVERKTFEDYFHVSVGGSEGLLSTVEVNGRIYCCFITPSSK